MGDYSKAWVLLLEYVEKMALSDTTEVSLSALKALQVSKIGIPESGLIFSSENGFCCLSPTERKGSWSEARKPNNFDAQSNTEGNRAKILIEQMYRSFWTLTATLSVQWGFAKDRFL